MLYNIIHDARHGAAIHEAGHASFAWHFSERNLAHPPFTEIILRQAPNSVGDYYGYVDMPLSTLQFNPATKAAIYLAGIFAKECTGEESSAEWSTLVRNREGTDGTDDFASVIALSKTERISLETLLSRSHQILFNLPCIADLIASIADLLEDKERIHINDPGLTNLLRQYPQTMP